MSKVCLLSADHAEALEDRGVIPDCQYHLHLSHREADRAVGLERDEKTKRMLEGWGSMRTVLSIDGRRRITPIPQVLGYTSMASGFGGPTTLQAVRAELH